MFPSTKTRSAIFPAGGLAQMDQTAPGTGVSWVLKHLNVMFLNNSGALAGLEMEVQSPVGTIIFDRKIFAPNAAVVELDMDLDLLCPQGQAVRIVSAQNVPVGSECDIVAILSMQ